MRISKKISKICSICEKIFIIPEYREYHDRKVKYCSKKCADEGFKLNIGEKHGNFKGIGHINSNGYSVLPRIGKTKHDYFHRKIMEKHIGRKLKDSEEVHHINKNKSDNRIENLYLCKSRSEHVRLDQGWKLKGDKWFKSCPKCKIELEVSTENFYRRSNGNWVSRCKKCNCK